MPKLRRSFGAAMAALLALSALATAALPAAAGMQSSEQVIRGTLVHRIADGPGGTASAAWSVRSRANSTVNTQSSASGARLAVVLFTLPGVRTLDVTPAMARDTYFGSTNSVAQFYRDASNTAFTLSGTVVGPYALANVDVSDCLVDDWAAAARSAAAAAGVDLSGYSNIAWVFPWVSVCPWSGMAEVSGSNSYINGPEQGGVGLYHATHEFGHNLGSGHAHAYVCSSAGVPESIGPDSDCATDEYGDPFSVMGNGVTRLPNGWERLQMGFLHAANTLRIATPGTYRVRLGTLEMGAGVRLLEVQRADGSFLDIDYLHPYGSFDAYAPNDPAIRGVLLHLVPSGPSAETSLLDATPATATFDDAALAPGRSLSDADGGVSVTVVGIDATGATLDVSVVAKDSGGTDTSAPMAPAGLAVAPQSAGVALSWQPALDNVAATSYRITRDGQWLGQTTGERYTDESPTNAAHTYAVVAVDASGNVGPASTVQFAAVDQAAPSTPANVTVRRASASTARVRWAVATDNIGVAYYRVRVDSRAPITTTSLSATLRSLSRGRHRIWVWAVDSAGNVGPSVRVTVRS